jgi:hypothetical protein
MKAKYIGFKNQIHKEDNTMKKNENHFQQKNHQPLRMTMELLKLG